MTDLEQFVLRSGTSARRIRDDDLAYGRDPVWMTADQNWQAFADAVLREPTDELKALFLSGWSDCET